MCKTYNTIGSLATLKFHLHNSSIHDFKSLKEVMDFQNSYLSIQRQLVFHHAKLIEEEKNILKSDLPLLHMAIENQRRQAEQRLTDEIDNLKQQLSNSAKTPQQTFFGS